MNRVVIKLRCNEERERARESGRGLNEEGGKCVEQEQGPRGFIVSLNRVGRQEGAKHNDGVRLG